MPANSYSMRGRTSRQSSPAIARSKRWNGGLDWRDVRPRIELLFAGMPEIDAMVYEPMDQAAPESQYRDQRIVRGSRVG